MTGSYRTGRALAVVGPHGAAMVPAGTSDDVLAALRAALGEGTSGPERAALVLDALTLGQRMVDLAPFAAAVLDDGTAHVLARGSFALRAGRTGDAEEVAVHGSGVTSWREQSVADVTWFEIAEEDAPRTRGGARRLPLEDGVVLATAVRLVLTTEGADDGALADEGVGESEGPESADAPGPAEGPAAAPSILPSAPPSSAPPLGVPPADAWRPTGMVVPPAPAPPSEGVARPRVDPTEAAVVPPQPGPGHTTLAADVTAIDGSSVPASAAGTESAEGEADYAYKWQATVDAVAAPAGGAPAAAPPSPASAPVDHPLGDHDGYTVSIDDLLAGPPGVLAPPPAPAPTGGVLSRYCVAEHQNPPHAPSCLICGQPLNGDPRLGPRPVLGRVRLSDGQAVALDRTVILGRRPQAVRVSAGEVPALVTVGGQKVSRSHLELRVEDWSVIASDLGSSNGTILLRAGQPPVRLAAPTPVRNGDRFDLGDGVLLTAEDVP